MRDKGALRAFVCYAHEDEALACVVQKAFEDHLKWHVAIDRKFGWGQDFHDAIKTGIIRSHLFVPLLTEASRARPWVHQEIGFALAVGVAILPVVADQLQPDQLIGSIQAAIVDRNLTASDLAERLLKHKPERLALDSRARHYPVTHVAFYPEERTMLLVQYASEIPAAAHLRQDGGLSSFSIPETTDEQAWVQREGDSPAGDFHRDLLRQERRALEAHALGAGCSLIFSPLKDMAEAIGKVAAASRGREAVSFLKRVASAPNVEVRLHPKLSRGNLTILGNWFCAESLVPRAGKGYWQTVFSWHAASVSKAIDRFDREFDRLERIDVTEAIGRVEEQLRLLE